MTDKQYEPSKAEMLASLVTGNASYSHVMASVQRSHRFPLFLFVQMENMAKLGGVPVSLIINELIECGLDAVRKELPEDVTRQVSLVTKDQTERPTVTDRVEVKGRKVGGKSKPGRSK